MDRPNVMVRFWLESPAEMFLIVHHTIHFSVIVLFAKDEEREKDADCIDDCVGETDSIENGGKIQNILQALSNNNIIFKESIKKYNCLNASKKSLVIDCSYY